MELPHRRRPSGGGSRGADAVNTRAAEDSIDSGRGDGIYEAPPSPQADSLKLLHRIRTPSSVLALAVDEQCVFAGLQGGRIQVSR